MSKEYTNIKANGLRNELKEIRKSLDKLTNTVAHVLEIWAHTQTHTRNEKDIIDCSNAFCSMHVCKCTGKSNCN